MRRSQTRVQRKPRMNKWLLLTIVLLVVFAAFYIGNALNNYNKMVGEYQMQKAVSARFIGDKLESVAELTTAKMTYNGIVEYQSGDIPFVNQKGFLMVYRAEIRAGIDLKDVESQVTTKQVKIIVPNATIQSVEIAPDSIKIYDQKSAIFNWVNQDDSIEAMKIAEKDVKTKGDLDALMERSKEQTGLLLKGLFEDSIGNRELIIEYEKTEE